MLRAGAFPSTTTYNPMRGAYKRSSQLNALAIGPTDDRHLPQLFGIIEKVRGAIDRR
jgi:hypothetical protein